MKNQDLDRIAEVIGGLEKWAHQCHAASLAIVKTGILPAGSRVARGQRFGITSQHSWVVTGNPYDPDVTIVDATLWSYTNRPPGIAHGVAGKMREYQPHGSGSIWEFGKPPAATGDVIALKASLSAPAEMFLGMVGPLDRRGWWALANSPIGGWPAGEIIAAMYHDDRLRAVIPIDVVGMATDINPGGLYF